MKKKQKQHYTGKKWIAALVVIVLIFAAIYYYIALPAINIHNPELWKFVLFVLVIAFALYALPKTTFTGDRRHPVNFSGSYKTKTFKLLAALIVIIAAAYFVGTLLSSPIINASKYQKLMKVEKSKFTKDIDQISYDQIPLLDKSSAEILGARKMGSLVDLASQFEVADEYSQINYKNNPVRVTPLRYADLIKWFTNKKAGIPAYIKIDMATQQTELVRLKE